MSKFRQIGAGACGSVWMSCRDDSSAFKREDGSPGRSLSNDFEMHNRVRESLRQFDGLKATDLPLHIQVPQCRHFIAPEDEWWGENLPNFPQGYSPCNVLHSERIPPLPQNVRELLIDRYCPAPLIAEIKASDTNQDCLIRLYLGRRRTALSSGDRPSRFNAFSLRNFPIHADQFEQLDASANALIYAEVMAEALAVMHWHAGIDANDVEFVLAPPRDGTEFKPSNILGDHTMWLFDFDCCRPMPMDEKGVAQAVAAFFRNDPYYPRPGQDLWAGFRARYLHTSSDIVRAANRDHRRIRLPMMFVEGIEEVQRKRNERRFS
ncbi:MAG: hypothetical protein M1840_006746 [Geoglossum simile]|nr:MAG: hypothetical protein M1840_006746 [Geoglossum simile]